MYFPSTVGDNVKVKAQYICSAIHTSQVGVGMVTNDWCVMLYPNYCTDIHV